MEKIFEEQLKINPKATLIYPQSRTFHSGRKVEEGDVCLFGLLVKNDFTTESGLNERELELVLISDKDFDLYQPDERKNGLIVPTFKLKNNG
jgi:hypothetical protein